MSASAALMKRSSAMIGKLRARVVKGGVEVVVPRVLIHEIVSLEVG